LFATSNNFQEIGLFERKTVILKIVTSKSFAENTKF
jgi:hypothetical protein